MQFSLIVSNGHFVQMAGHLVQMEEGKGRLPKRAEAVKQRGCRKRPQLRWEDCIKKDVRKAEEDIKRRAADREQWKMNNNQSSAAVQELVGLAPLKGTMGRTQASLTCKNGTAVADW